MHDKLKGQGILETCRTLDSRSPMGSIRRLYAPLSESRSGTMFFGGEDLGPILAVLAVLVIMM